MPDRAQPNGERRGRTPVLEWIAAGVGMIITIGMLGFIGWNAYRGLDVRPPSIMVQVDRIVPYDGGYIVEVTAKNRSPNTAAAVQIEGQLSVNGAEVATSQATLDYVPGLSERQGGLFFREDPRSRELDVRALGYAKP